MHQFWSSVIQPLLECGQPHTIVAAELDGAGLEDRLRDALSDDVALHRIEPDGRGFATIESIGEIDLAILAGEPNWYTVFHQLAALERRSLEDGRPFPVVVVLGVRWPYGRRDMYPDPDRIPAEFLQPHERRGVVVGSSKLVPDAMFADRVHALLEHGPRNGVRTALDDFIAQSYRRWRFLDLPGLGGIGALASSDRLEAQPELEEAFERFAGAQFLVGHAREIELARVNADAESQRAHAEVEQLGTRTRDFESELRARTHEHERLLDEQRTVQARIEELERLHLESETEHVRLAQQLTEAERASQAVLDERARSAERIAELEATLAEHRHELERARSAASEATARLAEAAAELEEERGARASAEAQLVTAERAHCDSERALGWLRRDEQRRQAVHEAELGALKLRAREVEAEREHLRAHYEQERIRTAQRVGELEQALGAARGQVESFRLERDGLAGDLTSERVGREAAESELAGEREVRGDALELARRIGETRSWKLGHRVFSLLRLLTFRRTRGTSAVTRLVNRLEAPQFEQTSGTGREPTDTGQARDDIRKRE